MRNQSIIATVSLALGVCLIGVFVWAADPELKCQKPNPSTKACYDPDNAVATCGSASQGECSGATGSSIMYVYEIVQFPDDTVKTDKGATKTESTDCWRRKGCVWNTSTNHCDTFNDWGLWCLKEKIVDNPDVTCSEE